MFRNAHFNNYKVFYLIKQNKFKSLNNFCSVFKLICSTLHFTSFSLPPPQAIPPVMSMPVRRLKFEIWDEGLRSCKACWITCRLLGFWCRLLGRVKFLQNYMAHHLPIFSNPVFRVLSEYILEVMADKSDEELQIMEGFTSTSDSDNGRCESIIWPNGISWLYTHAFK
jgi:hypothetical protein